MLKKTSRDLLARVERGFNESFASKCPRFEPVFWSILHFFSALAYFWDKSVKNHFRKGGDKLEIPKPIAFSYFSGINIGWICLQICCLFRPEHNRACRCFFETHCECIFFNFSTKNFKLKQLAFPRSSSLILAELVVKLKETIFENICE